MKDIKDLTLNEIEGLLREWKQKPFHASQIFLWIYKKGIKDFTEMNNLPWDLRKQLQENFGLYTLKIARVFKSRDGTQRLLFKLKDANFIEAVSIPTEKRITGCASTQVGCKFACKFCASGLMGFKRNLTCAEMLDEILYLKNSSKNNKLTHLVFMGIGEPLDNYDNVLRAIRMINSPYALNIAARRITISTCGIIPGIKRLATEGLQIELSVSLHAADDKTRSEIMPINKKYPLKTLLEACKDYIRKTNRQITFEYILIKGINSGLQDAQNLIKILAGLKLCKINLIPCNPIKEYSIEPPNRLETLFFKDCLVKGGLNVTLRRPRGEDIAAACGQLRLRYEKK